MSWLENNDAHQTTTGPTVDPEQDVHTMDLELLSLIQSIWMKNDTFNNLKKMTKLAVLRPGGTVYGQFFNQGQAAS